MHASTRWSRTLLCAFASTVLSTPAFATDLTWGGITGAAGTAANWTPAQAPTAADRLIFDIAGPYVVQFGSLVPQSLAHRISVPQVTSRFLTPHVILDDLVITSSVDTAGLRVREGKVTVSDDLRVGADAGNLGKLRVTEDGVLHGVQLSGSLLLCGSQGYGRIEVTEGGNMRWGGGAVFGGISGGTGDLLVSGFHPSGPSMPSTLRGDSASAFTMLTGALDVSTGGLFSWSDDVNLGWSSGGDVDLDVAGATTATKARFEVNGDLRLGYNPDATAGGAASLRVGDGGEAVVSGTTYFGDPDGGGVCEIRIEEGGWFETNSLVKGTPGQIAMTGGTLRVVGGPIVVPQINLAGGSSESLFELRGGTSGYCANVGGSDAIVIGSNGLARMELHDDATVLQVTSGITRLGVGGGAFGRLRLHDGSQFGSSLASMVAGVAGSADILVDSGSLMSVKDLDMAEANSGISTLLVDGAASQVIVAGHLGLGGTSTAAGGIGHVNLSNNSRLTLNGTPASGTIWPAGVMTLDASRLFPEDSVHVHGSLFNDGGTIDGGAIVVRDGGLLQGSGDVASVMRSYPGGTIRASGPLTLGIDGVTDACKLNGLLDVGPHLVTLRGTGVQSLRETTLNGGELQLPSSTRLESGASLSGHGRVSSATLYNHGRIVATLADGLTFDRLIVGEGEGVSGTSFRFRAGGGFTGKTSIASTIRADSGSWITADGMLTLGSNSISKSVRLDAFVNLNGNNLRLASADSVFFGGFLDLDGGEMSWPGKAMSMSSAGHIYDSGRLEGSASVHAKVSPGDVLPSVTTGADLATESGLSSPAAGRIEWEASQVVLEADGRYECDLGDHAIGEWDTLDVSGTLTLAGTLELRRLPTFVAVPGDSFRVLRCGTVSGVFSNVTLDGAPMGGEFAVHYGTEDVWVVYSGGAVDVPPAPGFEAAALRFTALGSPGRAPAFALDLPEAAEVRVRLFDVSGRQVARLHEGLLMAGRHRFAPPAGTLPPGIAFARASIVTADARIERIARVIVPR